MKIGSLDGLDVSTGPYERQLDRGDKASSFEESRGKIGGDIPMPNDY